MKKRTLLCAELLIMAGVCLSSAPARGGEGRTVVSLDGTWQIEDNVSRQRFVAGACTVCDADEPVSVVDLCGNWAFTYTRTRTENPPPESAFVPTMPVPGCWDDRFSQAQAMAMISNGYGKISSWPPRSRTSWSARSWYSTEDTLM